MFPKMLYRDGTNLADHRTVADETQLQAAAADGYLPLDLDAAKGGKADKPVEKRGRKAAAADGV